MNIFIIFQSIYIVFGRSLLFIVGPPEVVNVATLISGAQELIQRSTIAIIDDFLRVHLFKAPMDAQTRLIQIKIWTQDICSSQMIELATIPVLGILGPSVCRHAATFTILSTADYLTQDKMVVLVFIALLTEIVVDVASLVVERRQGILLESWWSTIK
mmetsp:Transcript_11620/g.31319  ORF Transcript_11620/g.31319 Transcript_11620/m.31319 type:complete len:158 (-) Transcript_11620:345-818(-)